MNIAHQLAKDIAAIPAHNISALNQAGSITATADFADREKHLGKMSSTEYADLQAKHYNEERELDRMRAFTEGPPPAGDNLAGFTAWRHGLEDKLDSLRSGRAKLAGHIAAPTATAATLKTAVTTGARKLLASMGLGSAEPETAPESSIDPDQLEMRLLAERRAAATAVEAIEIVDVEIAETEKQLAAVTAREKSFLDPALLELGEPLAIRYVSAINQLREVYSLIGALGDELGTPGRFGGTGFDAFPTIELPKPNLAGCRLAPPDKFKIKIDPNHRAFWKNARNTKRANPAAKIPLPKLLAA